jgi:putative transposase
VERLGEILQETKTVCYAWALIPNHFHLLLRTAAVPISTVMRRLLTGYALWYNRRHRRHGHLFQNRFKSILCQEDVYFFELVRYIHLNPIRAGLVDDIDELGGYRYSGHSVLMGKVKNVWQDTGRVLGVRVEEVWAEGKYRRIVEARGLLCYWAVRELGVPMSSLARKLGISIPSVSESVTRGRRIVETRRCLLLKT